ncbi:hypothetical protein NOCARDAX2BIS_380021 [Nocardioides sp. AX2bis]|nr:hypothetical protein NOCARDAX2BIS_380021 [Nocardioides sp. AX2bis]
MTTGPPPSPSRGLRSRGTPAGGPAVLRRGPHRAGRGPPAPADHHRGGGGARRPAHDLGGRGPRPPGSRAGPRRPRGAGGRLGPLGQDLRRAGSPRAWVDSLAPGRRAPRVVPTDGVGAGDARPAGASPVHRRRPRGDPRPGAGAAGGGLLRRGAAGPLRGPVPRRGQVRRAVGPRPLRPGRGAAASRPRHRARPVGRVGRAGRVRRRRRADELGRADRGDGRPRAVRPAHPAPGRGTVRDLGHRRGDPV